MAQDKSLRDPGSPLETLSSGPKSMLTRAGKRLWLTGWFGLQNPTGSLGMGREVPGYSNPFPHGFSFLPSAKQSH